MSQWLPRMGETHPMLAGQLTLKLKDSHQDGLSQDHTSRGLTGSSWSEMASKQLTDSTNTEQSHQPCSTVFLSKIVMLEIQGKIQSTISLGCLCFISMSSELPCWNKICCEKKKKVVVGGGEIPEKKEWRRMRINLRGRRKSEKAAK